MSNSILDNLLDHCEFEGIFDYNEVFLGDQIRFNYNRNNPKNNFDNLLNKKLVNSFPFMIFKGNKRKVVIFIDPKNENKSLTNCISNIFLHKFKESFPELYSKNPDTKALLYLCVDSMDLASELIMEENEVRFRFISDLPSFLKLNSLLGD